jgi:hypothetical protein
LPFVAGVAVTVPARSYWQFDKRWRTGPRPAVDAAPD